uniref:CAP-ZIP_m domain-containing protein n=1 Tax=Panagrellus redivivus TaxID=6233 RepID=A0A7E4WDF7_PANRE
MSAEEHLEDVLRRIAAIQSAPRNDSFYMTLGKWFEDGIRFVEEAKRNRGITDDEPTSEASPVATAASSSGNANTAPEVVPAVERDEVNEEPTVPRSDTPVVALAEDSSENSIDSTEDVIPDSSDETSSETPSIPSLSSADEESDSAETQVLLSGFSSSATSSVQSAAPAEVESPETVSNVVNLEQKLAKVEDQQTKPDVPFAESRKRPMLFEKTEDEVTVKRPFDPSMMLFGMSAPTNQLATEIESEAVSVNAKPNLGDERDVEVQPEPKVDKPDEPKPSVIPFLFGQSASIPPEPTSISTLPNLFGSSAYAEPTPPPTDDFSDTFKFLFGVKDEVKAKEPFPDAGDGPPRITSSGDSQNTDQDFCNCPPSFASLAEGNNASTTPESTGLEAVSEATDTANWDLLQYIPHDEFVEQFAHVEPGHHEMKATDAEDIDTSVMDIDTTGSETVADPVDTTPDKRSQLGTQQVSASDSMSDNVADANPNAMSSLPDIPALPNDSPGKPDAVVKRCAVAPRFSSSGGLFGVHKKSIWDNTPAKPRYTRDDLMKLLRSSGAVPPSAKDAETNENAVVEAVKTVASVVEENADTVSKPVDKRETAAKKPETDGRTAEVVLEDKKNEIDPESVPVIDSHSPSHESEVSLCGAPAVEGPSKADISAQSGGADKNIDEGVDHSAPSGNITVDVIDSSSPAVSDSCLQVEATSEPPKDDEIKPDGDVEVTEEAVPVEEEQVLDEAVPVQNSKDDEVESVADEPMEVDPKSPTEAIVLHVTVSGTPDVDKTLSNVVADSPMQVDTAVASPAIDVETSNRSDDPENRPLKLAKIEPLQSDFDERCAEMFLDLKVRDADGGSTPQRSDNVQRDTSDEALNSVEDDIADLAGIQKLNISGEDEPAESDEEPPSPSVAGPSRKRGEPKGPSSSGFGTVDPKQFFITGRIDGQSGTTVPLLQKHQSGDDIDAEDLPTVPILPYSMRPKQEEEEEAEDDKAKVKRVKTVAVDGDPVSRHTFNDVYQRANKIANTVIVIDENGERVELLQKVTEVVLDDNAESPDPKPVAVHPALVKHLKPHQATGIKFLYNCVVGKLSDVTDSQYLAKRNGAILSHCMGLGKTLQAIAFLHTIMTHEVLKKYYQRAMIICPAGLLYNWANEFVKWLGDGREPGLNGLKTIDLSQDTAKNWAQKQRNLREWLKGDGTVLLVSLDLFSRKDSFQHLVPYLIRNDKNRTAGADIIICDESHKLSNDKSARSANVRLLTSLSRIGLTGTPLQNRLEEYFHIVDWVAPGMLGKIKEFRTEFAEPIKEGATADADAVSVQLMKSQTAVLNRQLDLVMDRKDYAYLSTILPPKREYVFFLRMTPKHEEIYRKFMATQAHSMSPFEREHHIYRLGTQPYKLLEEQRAKKTEAWFGKTITDADKNVYSDSEKVNIVLDLIKMFEQEGAKAIVFSQYLEPIAVLKAALKKASKTWFANRHVEHMEGEQWGWQENLDYYTIIGDTTMKDRSRVLTRFNDPDNHRGRLLFMSKAACEGLNMTGATKMILFEAKHNPELENQALFRAYRIGQTKPFTAFRLVYYGTMEACIFKRQIIKQQNTARILDNNGATRTVFVNEVDYSLRFEPAPSELNYTTQPHYRLGALEDAVITDFCAAHKDALVDVCQHDTLVALNDNEKLPEDEVDTLWNGHVGRQSQGVPGSRSCEEIGRPLLSTAESPTRSISLPEPLPSSVAVAFEEPCSSTSTVPRVPPRVARPAPYIAPPKPTTAPPPSHPSSSQRPALRVDEPPPPVKPARSILPDPSPRPTFSRLLQRAISQKLSNVEKPAPSTASGIPRVPERPKRAYPFDKPVSPSIPKPSTQATASSSHRRDAPLTPSNVPRIARPTTISVSTPSAKRSNPPVVPPRIVNERVILPAPHQSAVNQSNPGAIKSTALPVSTHTPNQTLRPKPQRVYPPFDKSTKPSGSNVDPAPKGLPHASRMPSSSKSSTVPPKPAQPVVVVPSNGPSQRLNPAWPPKHEIITLSNDPPPKPTSSKPGARKKPPVYEVDIPPRRVVKKTSQPPKEEDIIVLSDSDDEAPGPSKKPRK